MSYLKIQHNPWSTQITHPDQFTATNQYQWHEGTQTIYNKVKGWAGESNNIFSTNGIKWYRQAAGGTIEGDQKRLWLPDGFISYMQNGKNYNQIYFFGSQVDDINFTNDSFTYSTTSKSSFVQDVIGFAAQTDIAGSFSDEGGDAQARLEKIAFFYMDPSTRVRSTYLVDYKLGGSTSLDSKFTKSMGRNKQWFSYRVDSSHVTTINNKKLAFMGIGMQFYHGSKTQSHTSGNRISNFRILTGTSPYPGNYTQATTLYCFPQPHSWNDRSNPQCFSVP